MSGGGEGNGAPTTSEPRQRIYFVLLYRPAVSLFSYRSLFFLIFSLMFPFFFFLCFFASAFSSSTYLSLAFSIHFHLSNTTLTTSFLLFLLHCPLRTFFPFRLVPPHFYLSLSPISLNSYFSFSSHVPRLSSRSSVSH